MKGTKNHIPTGQKYPLPLREKKLNRRSQNYCRSLHILSLPIYSSSRRFDNPRVVVYPRMQVWLFFAGF
jgi:hypothetical protein